jgi:hypothetical protein
MHVHAGGFQTGVAQLLFYESDGTAVIQRLRCSRPTVERSRILHRLNVAGPRGPAALTRSEKYFRPLDMSGLAYERS